MNPVVTSAVRWAIVPVKSLQRTKSRLSPVLTPAERSSLTRRLLHRTLQILHETAHFDAILVATRDPLAQQIARQEGALTFAESPLQQLNGALTEASSYATAAGATELLILPTDLPCLTPADLDLLIAAHQPHSLVICSDTEQLGTNALLLPADTPFTYRFGKNSYARHTAEARRHNLIPITVITFGLTFDLDTPADWHTFCQLETLPQFSTI